MPMNWLQSVYPHDTINTSIKCEKERGIWSAGMDHLARWANGTGATLVPVRNHSGANKFSSKPYCSSKCSEARGGSFFSDAIRSCVTFWSGSQNPRKQGRPSLLFLHTKPLHQGLPIFQRDSSSIIKPTQSIFVSLPDSRNILRKKRNLKRSLK